MNEAYAFGLQTPLAVTPAGQSSNGSADWFPPVDILEDAREYLFKVDLPDVEPENIKVFVEDDGLVITGDRSSLPLDGKQCIRGERPRGHFERRFALPDDASREEIQPLFKGCVLELHVPKVSSVARTPEGTSPPPNSKPHAE